MRVYRHVNMIFSSNTYILSLNNTNGVYIVDPGDCEAIFNWLESHNCFILGILLTHAHFDHIYGLNELLDKFTTIKLYVSPSMIDGLFSDKINTSKYHEKPYVLNQKHIKNILFLKEGYNQLLWDNKNIFVLYTPGHTNDSICFNIDNYLFTGDALIPGIKVYKTKKNGNTELIICSLKNIYNSFPKNTLLLPGHGKDFLLDESKQIKDFFKLDTDNHFIRI